MSREIISGARAASKRGPRVISGLRRENLIRSLAKFGGLIGFEDFGSAYVQDGKVWLIDAATATLLGDCFEYLAAARGRRPGFVAASAEGGAQ